MSNDHTLPKQPRLIRIAVKHVPGWLPGTGFKQIALRIKATANEGATRPWRFVEEQMAQGKHLPSFVSNLLDGSNVQMSEEETFYAQWTALSVYLGGADTVKCIASYTVGMTTDTNHSPPRQYPASSSL